MTDNVLDLDAARAAVADDEKSPLPLRVGGETFYIERPLKISVAVAAAEGNLGKAVGDLFGDNARAILDAGLTLPELRSIIDRLIGADGDSGNGRAGSST